MLSYIEFFLYRNYQAETNNRKSLSSVHPILGGAESEADRVNDSGDFSNHDNDEVILEVSMLGMYEYACMSTIPFGENVSSVTPVSDTPSKSAIAYEPPHLKSLTEIFYPEDEVLHGNGETEIIRLADEISTLSSTLRVNGETEILRLNCDAEGMIEIPEMTEERDMNRMKITDESKVLTTTYETQKI